MRDADAVAVRLAALTGPRSPRARPTGTHALPTIVMRGAAFFFFLIVDVYVALTRRALWSRLSYLMLCGPGTAGGGAGLRGSGFRRGGSTLAGSAGAAAQGIFRPVGHPGLCTSLCKGEKGRMSDGRDLESAGYRISFFFFLS